MLERFLYKHRQVLSLAYGGQHGFPKSKTERQGIFTTLKPLKTPAPETLRPYRPTNNKPKRSQLKASPRGRGTTCGHLADLLSALVL